MANIIKKVNIKIKFLIKQATKTKRKKKKS